MTGKYRLGIGVKDRKVQLMSLKNGFKTNGIKIECFIFLAAFLFHCVLIYPMKAPMIIDEYLTFTDAAFLSGVYDWSAAYSSLPKISYYGWGLALLYIPFFYVSDDVFLVYKCCLYLNALLASFIPLIVYKICKLNDSDTVPAAKQQEFMIQHQKGILNISIPSSNLRAMVIALAVGTYGPVMYLTKAVWNETGLIVIPWFLLYVLCLLYKKNYSDKKFCLLSLVAGFLTAYAYTINGRGLALIVAAVVVYVYITIANNKKKGMLFFFPMMFLVFILNAVIKNYILDNLLATSTEVISNINLDVTSRLSNINFASILDALRGYWGNIFYVIAATFGFVVIGLVVYVGVIFGRLDTVRAAQSPAVSKGESNRKRAPKYKQRPLAEIIAGYAFIYLIINMGIIFVSGYKRYILSDYTRNDYFMYGRYFDAIIPVCIFAVFLLITEYKITKKIYVIAVLIFAFFVGTTYRYVVPVMLETGKSFQVLNVGILNTLALNSTFWNSPEKIGYLMMAVSVIVLFALICVLVYKKKFSIIGIIFIIFNVLVALETSHVYIWRTSTSKYENLQKYETILNALDTEYDEIYYISYGGRAINIQFMIPDYKITQLNTYIYGGSVLSNISDKNCFIMSDRDEGYENFIEDCYKLADTGSMYIWAYGEELKNELTASGVVLIGDENSGNGAKRTFAEYGNSFEYVPLDSDAYRKSYRVIGENSSYAATWYYMGEGSYIYSVPIKLSAGTYSLDVTGINIALNLVILDDEGNHLEEIEPVTSEIIEGINFRFDVKEDLEMAQIYLVADSKATLADFDELTKIKRIRLYRPEDAE